MDELEKEIVLIIDKLEHLGWIVRQNATLSIPVDEQLQKQLLTLAHLSASSLNNMSMIAALLQQYAPLQALSLKELEKMGKAVLNKLSQTKKIQAGYYFDSATLKSFIAILKQNKLLYIQEDRFIISDDFEEKISAIFNWYNPEIQQAIIEALQFNEKELKGFKQAKKI
jgi:glycerol-3-phosphate O-acyltransferase